MRGRRSDGLCEKHGLPGPVKNTGAGVYWVLRKIKKTITITLNGFFLCRLYKLRTEQKIQTAEVQVKRMQGVE